MTLYELSKFLSDGRADSLFSRIYRDNNLEKLRQRARYFSAAENFSKAFPLCDSVHIFSVPSFMNICGGFSEIDFGEAVMCAVTCDMVGLASYHEEPVIRIFSDFSQPTEIDLAALTVNESADSSTLYQIAAELLKRGCKIRGADIYVSSDIPENKGFSRDVPFDVLIADILNCGCDFPLSDAEIAEIVTSAEGFAADSFRFFEVYLCTVGGMLHVTPNAEDKNFVHKIEYDFTECGYSVCMNDTSDKNISSYSENEEIHRDIEAVAKAMGVEKLCDVAEEDFYGSLAEIRQKCSERAALRGIVYFEEKNLTAEAADALITGRSDCFFACLDKIAMGLNNRPTEAVELAFRLSRKLLCGCGAVKVSGGNVQAFVPNYMINYFTSAFEDVFGHGSTLIFSVRKGKIGEIYV